ncbi:MAG TPA: NAD(P)-dependent oxidoreductase [Acidobacteriaceae bacterium]|jgi:nucleoside-diphosphate-sugar epimerase
MKIIVAGASGAMGRALVPLLVGAGHDVVGMVRRPQSADVVRSLGAEPRVADALDAGAVLECFREARPEVVIHQLTAIPASLDMRHFDRDFALTNLLWTEGTRNLLAAAVDVGATHFIAQSFAGWTYGRKGNGKSKLKTEEDPFDPDPPAKQRATLDALKTLERAVLSESRITGAVLRYGAFYGPHTSIAKDGSVVKAVRQRKLPLVGEGAGVWSFIHVEDAASATAAVVESRRGGVYNVVDDEPAPVSEWLSFLAHCAHAQPPRQVPAWLARLLIGEHVVAVMNEIRGVSNAKIKRELRWTPRWPSWREGFRESLKSASLPVRELFGTSQLESPPKL